MLNLSFFLCKNGIINENPYLTDMMKSAVREGVLVAGKRGICLPYDDPFDKVRKVCAATADNICSMLQDIRSGRKTEIDAINGALAAEGQRAGIPMPTNSMLTDLVRSLEKVGDTKLI